MENLFYPRPLAYVQVLGEATRRKEPESGVDAHLVEKARAGDSSAQEALVGELSPRLYRLALRMGCDANTAEDMVSESLYRGLVRLDKLAEPRAAGSWFCQILVNVWRDRLRKKKQDEILLEDLAIEPVAASLEAPDAALRGEELGLRVAREIELLPRGQRLVMTLSVDEGFEAQEIARILGTKVSQVKANLWHARRRLRERLADCLGPSTRGETR